MLDSILNILIVMLGGLSLIAFMTYWIAASIEDDFYSCSKQIVFCLVSTTLLFLAGTAKLMKHIMAM